MSPASTFEQHVAMMIAVAKGSPTSIFIHLHLEKSCVTIVYEQKTCNCIIQNGAYWWMLSFSSCSTTINKPKTPDRYTIVTFKGHIGKFRINCQRWLSQIRSHCLHCHNWAPNSEMFCSYTVQERRWSALVLIREQMNWT